MASNKKPETFKILILFLCLNEQRASINASSSIFPFNTSHNAHQTLQQKLLSRRRGLVPHSRRRGDTYSQLYQKAQSKVLWKQILMKHKSRAEGNAMTSNWSKSRYKTAQMKHKVTQQDDVINSKNRSVLTQHADEVLNLRRHKRWDYDENYDWENGGKDYVIPGEERKETKFEKFAKSWQKHAIKVIFLFSVVCMLCCCCLAICKKFCGKVCETICWHLRDYRDMCFNRDPSYRKARKFADDYGIELDYDQYTKIKKNYEEGFRRGGHDDYKNLSGR